MSESLLVREPVLEVGTRPVPRSGLAARLALAWEVVAGGFVGLRHSVKLG